MGSRSPAGYLLDGGARGVSDAICKLLKQCQLLTFYQLSPASKEKFQNSNEAGLRILAMLHCALRVLVG